MGKDISYNKYNDLILNVKNINKKRRLKVLKPYNNDEYAEYMCIKKDCRKYKGKNSRMDC